MKKIFLLLFLASQIVFSQKKYIKSDTDSFIDFTNKNVKLKFNEYSIEGTFVEVDGKDYKSYLIVNGGENIWVIRNSSHFSIWGMDILKGEYKTVLKEFNKGRKYKKSELLFTNLPSKGFMDGYRLISEREKVRIDKTNKAIIEFESKIKESQFLGLYKIKILKHRNLDYKSIDTYGKLYVTEVGITMETEIPSVDLIRGSYQKGNCDVEKGQFVCTINKGYGEIFSLSLNEEKTVGGLTTLNGKITTTTTFRIIE